MCTAASQGSVAQCNVSVLLQHMVSNAGNILVHCNTQCHTDVEAGVDKRLLTHMLQGCYVIIDLRSITSDASRQTAAAILATAG